jgi:integrase
MKLPILILLALAGCVGSPIHESMHYESVQSTIKKNNTALLTLHTGLDKAEVQKRLKAPVQTSEPHQIMSHTFQYHDKPWTLFKKKPTDAHYYFAPRWGDRGQKVFHCLKDKTTGRALTPAEAETVAKALILERLKGPTHYDALRDQTKLRGNLTVGQILDEWETAGFPGSDRRPRGAPQQKRQKDLLPALGRWWRPRLLNTIKGPTLGDYAEWRRANCRKGFSGDRVIDLDLNVLSCAFDWAVATGRAEQNPFKDRPRFQHSDDITHSPAYMPQSDEEFHILCGALLLSADPYYVVAGAQLIYLGLTGQRPGEAPYLRWDATFAGSHPEPGHRYPITVEGGKAELLAVHRLKGGINPAVRVRPALGAFLAAWQPYSQARWGSKFYFPNPSDPKTPFAAPNSRQLDKPLTDVATQLKLGERHPHAMRAYYVRVRRSQGADDSTIALELGQGSGAKMIVQTYGEARGIHGDGRFDWLPAGKDVVPCWERLPAPLSNIVHL